MYVVDSGININRKMLIELKFVDDIDFAEEVQLMLSKLQEKLGIIDQKIKVNF